MNWNPKPLIILAALLINGCSSYNLKNAIKRNIAPPQVQLEANKLIFRTASNSSLGLYTLETESGNIIAKADLKRESDSGKNSVFNVASFEIDFNDENFGVLNSCLQIRSPTNNLISVMTGLTSRDEKFYVPRLNFSGITTQIKEKERKLANLERSIKDRDNLVSALKNESAFNGDICEKPDPGPQPKGACLSRSHSDLLNGQYCAASTFVCGIGGMKTAKDILSKQLRSNNDVESLVTTFVQSSCSIVADKKFDKSTDIFTMLRSYLISTGVRSLLESFLENADSDLKDYAAEIIAGMVNYELCLSDSYSVCTDITRNWQSKGNQQFQQCLNVKSKLEIANRNVDYYGRDLKALTEEITKLKTLRANIIEEHIKISKARRVSQAVNCDEKMDRSFF